MKTSDQGKKGYHVETKAGIPGRTYHEKGTICGRVPVYPDAGGKPLLCNPNELKITGYID